MKMERMRFPLAALLVGSLALASTSASADTPTPLQVVVPQPPVVLQKLPNLVVSPRFTQQRDAKGRWVVDVTVANTGLAPAPVGAVRVEVELDGGSGAGIQQGMGIHQQYATTVVPAGGAVTLTFGVPGAVYVNGKNTSIGYLPSLAPYQLRVAVDYPFPGIAQTAEVDEDDNERVLDLH